MGITELKLGPIYQPAPKKNNYFTRLDNHPEHFKFEFKYKSATKTNDGTFRTFPPPQVQAFLHLFVFARCDWLQFEIELIKKHEMSTHGKPSKRRR